MTWRPCEPHRAGSPRRPRWSPPAEPDADPSGGGAGVAAVASRLMSETDSAPATVLRYPGGELPLPLVPATEGSDGLDTSKLLATTGRVALDIGFVNTASCTWAITYIDGDAGILRYRGYPIDQLAEK